MKRSRRNMLGNFPRPRADSIKAIADEMVKARNRYPTNARNLDSLEFHIGELRRMFTYHHSAQTSAPAVYHTAVVVAVLAIRCMEEGSGGFRYAGNVPPDLMQLMEKSNG